MSSAGLGITSAAFWVAALIGLLLIVPWTNVARRQSAIALLNLGFLGWIQRSWLLATLLLLLLSYAAVRVTAGGRQAARWAYGSAIMGALALFALCRAPTLASHAPASLALWLTTFGYSYVALRLLDELTIVRAKGMAPSFLEHVNYLVPFHMLAAGPIQSFADFKAEQAEPLAPPLTFGEALGAFERIALGLFKKVVLAHLIERLFLTGFRSSGWYYALEAQLFLVWLYLDFSSYSDIAVGIGRLLGLRTPENFDRPYLARDMVDFWQRWHISLSQWIRRNVFVPLQLVLQRRYPDASPLAAASATLLVAFALCGLWHQISWRYAAWGLMHAVGVVASNAWQTRLTRKLGRARYKEYLKRPLPRILGIVVTFEFVAWSLTFVGGKG